MEHLQAFIADCDRRTEAAKRRLAETQEELSAEVQTKANAVHELAEEIGKKLAKAEALGEAGQVEESMQLMGEIEELRAKKARAEHEYRSSIPASSYQQQKLRVCEVCSAYLGIHDNDVRLADHFGGKLHLGFLSIREKLIELEKTAAPRKKDVDRSRNRSSYESSSDRRRYVGARELDGRSRVHRSRSRERKYDSKRENNKSSSSRYDSRRSRSPYNSSSRRSRSPQPRGHSSSYKRRDRSRERDRR